MEDKKKTLDNVTVEKVENGFTVESSYRITGKDTWETEDHEFIFVTLDEALAKVKEVFLVV